MTFVDLPDPQRPGQRQAVRRSALFGDRRDDIDIAKPVHRFFKRDNPVGMNAVVVCDQDSKSFHSIYLSPFTGGLNRTPPRSIFKKKK